MRRLLGVAALLVIALFGLSFALLNATRVDVDYYFGVVAAPLSLALLIALILGAILGALSALGVLVGKQRELRRLRRRVRDSEKELSELRRLPLKDNR
ncbi:lipopolysaccharide assembly protein LapA domain-containing protein [Aquisalimonas lutea]|uniref:lipopolysaccharide assembly protein LapA domain-containing protein n=1 Tax=Aquisalimonas lutea TaxID=1327750 RepID=UPI0025B616FC|nr:lipopolysaccharide assembly protein LapA domain-containing protein [Aquisalimonas lutea]MDN3517689.1 lipopolysaccharide assembly protein LapA domain-containing protein [Aquisalimonas lutea]